MNQRPTVEAQRLNPHQGDFHEETNNVPAVHDGGAVPTRATAEPERYSVPVTPFANLAGAIAAVMAEIEPVEKAGWNKFQSYSYARIQDLMGTLTPLMGKHGIVIFQNEEGREMFDDGKAIAVRYRFTIVHKSGEVWPERILQTGLSNCRNSKDGFDDKSLNKCHTAARKYFLLSLFQIPTEDAEDADTADGGNRPRPQGQARRPVPSPTGKIGPHLLPIIDGEAPQAWGERYSAFIAKAETTAEIDQWYDLNAGTFDKLKGRFKSVYDDLIAGMDAMSAKLNGNTIKSDPISSGLAPATGTGVANDFPGDRPMKPSKAEISPDDYDWLESLENAFSSCESAEELVEATDKYMNPQKPNMPPAAWKRAVKILGTHTNRMAG